MRSILRFVFVVVPTAALASAVVVGVSRSTAEQEATADGDLLRDLKLASTATIEFAPAGQPVATISAIEAPPPAAPARSVRPKRSAKGTRVVRSRAPAVTAAAEPEVDESETSMTTELAAAPEEAAAEAPAAGGVALPRPTAIPVSFPTGGGDAGTDAGTYDPGPAVIRGGGVLDDHCQVHRGRGGRVYGPPIYRQPRGISLGDRIRGGQGERERTPSLGDRIRGAQSSSGSRSSSSVSDRRQASSSRPRSEGSSRSGGSSRGSLGDRIRSARGR